MIRRQSFYAEGGGNVEGARIGRQLGPCGCVGPRSFS